MINERNDLLNEKQPQKAQNLLFELLFEFSFIRLNSGHKSKNIHFIYNTSD